MQIETHTPTSPPLPITDVSEAFADWCFAALEAASGQRLVITDETSLSALYDFADGHCETALPRSTFDFSSQVLVVAVDAVRACRAEYIPVALENGRLMLQFVHDGTCPYDLVILYAGTLAQSADDIQVIVSGA